jgi:DNA-binding NarL/FixJ family response regulator
VRFVLCDADEYLRMMAEVLVERLGHEVVGVAVNNAIATELVTHARPDVVILDVSLGYNTDFDIIDAAVRVGARVIVFSHTADHAVLDRYSPKPVVVAKPDLHDLEKAIARVQATTADHGELTADRRQRPAAAADGPEPSGPEDAHAFYAAVGNGVEGDALLAVDAADGPGLTAAHAQKIADLIRDTDRILVSGSSLKVFLAGGGEAGIDAFVARIRGASELAPHVQVRSIVLGDDEGSSEAFDRLKSAESRRP